MKSEILHCIADECQEDYVGLWSILWEIRSKEPQLGPSERRDLTLEIVKLLLDDGTLVGDVIQDEGFVAWHLSKAEALKKIADGWEHLGREPTIGDVAWFTSPDSQGSIAKQNGASKSMDT